MTSTFAEESETPIDLLDLDGTECSAEDHDNEEVGSLEEQVVTGTSEDMVAETALPVETETASSDVNMSTEETTLIEQDAPEYTVLKTWSGIGIGIYGSFPETTKPGMVMLLVGSRPCLFTNCPNSVTVTSKYSFVCNAHKCSVAGCPWVLYYRNPNRCQVHAGITNVTCQAVDPGVFDGLCGKPSVGNGSPCCLEHYCPGCYGLGNGGGSLCDLCRQCWVPGCPNLSTCTNECNTHCPHTCKTHHLNHCTSCHADPCVCYPANPAITVKTWNSSDNSVAVEIISARATQIELYTSGGVLFSTINGTSGVYTFRHNAAQNNGSYYVRVTNAKGYNSGSFPFTISTLDTIAPVISGKTVQPDNSAWATSKTLTVTATDKTNITFHIQHADGSAVYGCADMAGSVNGSAFTATWILTEQIPSGENFKIIATDKWGYSSETTVMVSRIDGKKPSRPAISLSDSGEWHNEQIIATISGSSADSGIANYLYRINGGFWQTGYTAQIMGEGIHTIEAKSISGAGLESEVVSTTAKIDLTNPTASYTLSPEGWTTESVTICLSPSDLGGSGLACIMLPDGQPIFDLSNIKYTVFRNGEYSFTLTDNAGNSSGVAVPVKTIAILDVTATLNMPFVISPDSSRLYSGDICFKNNSNVPITLTLQSMTPYGNAPEIVGKDDKAWEGLTVSETRRYISLGLTGNGVDLWLDAQNRETPHSLGMIPIGSTAAYALQGRFGYAWEQAENFLYGMVIKVSIVG